MRNHHHTIPPHHHNCHHLVASPGNCRICPLLCRRPAASTAPCTAACYPTALHCTVALLAHTR